MSIKGVLVRDVASRCGLSEQMFCALVDQKKLPPPDITLRSLQGYFGYYYNRKEAERVVSFLKSRKK